MRLYLFQSGTIRTFKHLIVENAAKGQSYQVPVPVFLIQHPRGNVLFDTGQSLEDIRASKRLQEHPVRVDYQPVISDDQYIVALLKEIGLRPVDISYVVLSHLHLDHAGGAREFPHATCYLNRLDAGDPDFESAGELHWHFLDGDLDYDLFGDGKIKIISTPGHTPGHQSLLVTLDRLGPVLLASDSIYAQDILDGKSLPGVMYDRNKTINTIQQIQKMRNQGIHIIPGHDPSTWASLKLAPQYYD